MRNEMKCPLCGKLTKEQSRFAFGTANLIRLECGHTIQGAHAREKTDAEKLSEITSKTGFNPYPFQVEGSLFAEQAGLRCLITDEMGLGKTIQALITIKAHKKEMQPVLWVGKAGLKYQYLYECLNWLGMELIPCVIDSTREAILPGFGIYIVSYDTFWRIDPAKFSAVGIKTLVLDECQSIKNPTAKRTFALRKFAKDVPYCLGLSGTPIKNKAEEFFVMLNMMRPERFPTEASFYQKYIYYYQDSKGNYKSQGMKDPDQFKADTEDFIIRRTREQVMPDLPKVWRKFHHAEIEDPALKKAYDKVTEEFTEFFDEATIDGNDNNLEFYSNLLAFYARMRNLTGLAKIGPCAEFIVDFLTSTDRKITIFGHHKETLQILKERLNDHCKELGIAPVLHLHSDLGPEERYDLVQRFRGTDARILIASTLASGEGLNLQFCSDAVMLERQWNPANEEQAETRFTRIGSTADRVDVTYILSVGTIDEYLTEIVEKKRVILKSTLDNEQIQWDEQELAKELGAMIASKGAKKWAAPAF